MPHLPRMLVLVAWGLVVSGALGCGAQGPSPTNVAVAIAPLDLPGVTNVTYTLTVSNESGAQVWTRTLDADGAGDGVGSVSWVGPCDADDDPDLDGAATNTVAVTIDSIVTAAGPLVDGLDFTNPAPATAPATRAVACRANADVPVDFDLTVARRAAQGFFDIAVAFEDVFCSAKLDCVREGQPLELLFNAAGERDRTVVLGFACTGGLGGETFLYLDAIAIDCGAAGSAQIAPVGPAGNKGALPPILFQHAVYFGAELLQSGATSWGKAYWNVALGIDEAALSATSPCVLTAHGTATSIRFDTGAAPTGATWPQVDWDVTLNALGSATLTCANHAVFAPGSGVAVSYAQDVVWPYEMAPDLPNDGAGATASESGGNAVAPAWATGPDLGTLTYDAALDVTLTATDADPADTVTYSSPDLPTWLSLDPGTGRLTGATVDEVALGALSFDVVADDGLHQTTRTFSLYAQFAPACHTIKAASPGLSGVSVHTLDAVGDGTGVFDALCDMTTYGGGWTLVAAQFEADPVLWDEGRQADYDPSLASAASFALVGADLVAHNQVAFGRAASTGPGTWDVAAVDYLHFTYDPAADYAEVPVNGLATTRSYQLDRHLGGVHNSHDPEQYLQTVSPEWHDTLSLDAGGGMLYTWAYSPNYTTVEGRGFAFEAARYTAPDSFAWAVWVRDAPGSVAPSYADCDAWKTANPGMSGLSVQVIDPSGADPFLVMCDMTSWAGGWTLAAINFELDAILWDEGRQADYEPALRPSKSFALTGADLPSHGEAAFGRLQYLAPGSWSQGMIDYIDVVYDPSAEYLEETHAGKAPPQTASYQLDRHHHGVHNGHDPEAIYYDTIAFPQYVIWNDTLSFDVVTGDTTPDYTWAFSPNYTADDEHKGFGYLGSLVNTLEPYGWAVWVR
ncbi:MAG: hypothetical protein EP329_00705 [Deltaproteobacteria bacterium]|nr:MAG: hypothetical protein EP329_00705 [Deltaproteobacteria bacterium]